MILKVETHEQRQDLLTLSPVAKEGLGAPPALNHNDPEVNAQELKVDSAANSKPVTFP